MYVSAFYLSSSCGLYQVEQKQKYAIWKAAEIRKALKEGRRPEAGPPGGDKDEAPASTTTNSHVTHPNSLAITSCYNTLHIIFI